MCWGAWGGTHHSGTQPGTWPHAPWGRGRPLPLATALTDVGLLPRVLAHMGDEGAGLSEGFATHHTLARLLTWGRGTRHWHPLSSLCPFHSPHGASSPTRVDPYVPLQRAWVSKLPLTVGAYVGFLPTVDPQVPLEVPFGNEGRDWCAVLPGAQGRGRGARVLWAYLRW